MGRILGLVFLAAALVIATAPAAARASSANEVPLIGEEFYPESITAARNGALFVSSLNTGEIVRLAPGSQKQTTFVDADVNVGTAGVMVDPDRDVLWACAVDLTFKTTSKLRAFDLRTGALQASYEMPDGGVCADIAIARGDLYVTDTLLGRILRLTTPDCHSAQNGTLAVWSADRKLTGGAFLQINGIAFDGDRTLYTTNYSTGELFAVRIRPGGAGPAVEIRSTADGISRWHPLARRVPVRRQQRAGAVARRSAHSNDDPHRRLARSADVARVRPRRHLDHGGTGPPSPDE